MTHPLPTFTGLLEAIFIAPEAGGTMQTLEQVAALAGSGLAGDRYALRAGSWSAKPEEANELTLIEVETLAALSVESGQELAPEETRRNLLTRGVPLNHLVGRTFWIGEGPDAVRVVGDRLCEPCGYLERRTRPGIKDALKHRSGLRARILNDGWLHRGDVIRPD